MSPDPQPAPQVLVACLCAAWCRLCDEYAPVLEQGCAELVRSGVALRQCWIDIEDEAELIGDFDVETFPTLLIIDRQRVRFAGPVTPQPGTLHRLLRATVVDAGDGAHSSAVESEVDALAARLRERFPLA